MEPNTIRALTEADLDCCLELSTCAGWNQVNADWRVLLRLAPNGCFGIDMDGQLAATTTVVCYGIELAWVGMVLTRPEHRGHGLATALVQRAIGYSTESGVKTLKLDATAQGSRLYERLGFVEEQPVERWFRPGGGNFHVASCTSVDATLDREAMGVDRSLLLQVLSENGSAIGEENGFLLRRRGRVADYLGPCVATGAETARRLTTNCCDASSGRGLFWDLLPTNRKAVKIAEDLGFSRQRSLTRMYLGPRQKGREEWLYAIAGFELG
jgi:GNAT superfamily N-acetyltransferase